MSTQSIFHVTSRCGAGKSFQTISHLHTHFLKASTDDQDPGFFILASKTNDLSKQNYEQFHGLDNSQANVRYRLIDSTNTSDGVAQEIAKHVKLHKQGVLFVSHAAVALMDPKLLQGTTLIFDEVPDNLVREIRLQHGTKNVGQYWERFIIEETLPNSKTRKVTLRKDVDPIDVASFIDNIKKKRDNATTLYAANMLQFLLDGHEDLYLSSKTDHETTLNIYSGIDWKRFDDIRKHASRIAVLSAEFKHTLLGFVAEKIAGMKIEEVNVAPGIVLQDAHQKRAIIYPIIKDKSWSTHLKNQKADEALEPRTLPIIPHETVLDHAKRIVDSRMGSEKYLLIMNKRDKRLIGADDEHVEVISSSSHGSNKYTDCHHAAYLASKRPDPVEISTLNSFAHKYNLDATELKNCVITERCYESAYQCLARTSIRIDGNTLEGPHIFFVPDQHYAEYVAQWFAPGYAVIDNSLACSARPTKAKQTKRQKDIEVLANILSRHQSDKTPINVLVKDAGISISTYNRHRRDYKAEMRERGLM